MPTPEILYKVVSQAQYQQSQTQDNLVLSNGDHPFIHFSTEKQYPTIVQKFLDRGEPCHVLKVQTAELPGEMKYEVKPGKQEGYFHLYNGSIPMSSVELIDNDQANENNRSFGP